MQTLKLDGKYATETTITFTLRSPAATDSDSLYVTGPPDKTECFIFLDGVYSATATNAPTQSTTGGFDAVYKLVLTAGEMTADVIDIIVHAIAGKSGAAAFRDQHIQIRTKMKIGQIDVDASAIDAGSALKLTGYASTGKAIECTEDVYFKNDFEIDGAVKFDSTFAVASTTTLTGAVTLSSTLGTGAATLASLTVTGALTAASIVGVLTNMVVKSGTLGSQTGATTTTVGLEAGSSASDDFYKNGIILIYSSTTAANIGQARVITAYDATGGTMERMVTVNRAWDSQPTSGDKYVILPGNDVWGFGPADEIASSAALTKSPSYGVMIQALYQRFFFKHDQDAVEMNMYKSDGSTALSTATVDDDGTTQTIGDLLG